MIDTRRIYVVHAGIHGYHENIPYSYNVAVPPLDKIMNILGTPQEVEREGDVVVSLDYKYFQVPDTPHVEGTIGSLGFGAKDPSDIGKRIAEDIALTIDQYDSFNIHNYHNNGRIDLYKSDSGPLKGHLSDGLQRPLSPEELEKVYAAVHEGLTLPFFEDDETKILSPEELRAFRESLNLPPK